MIGRLWLPGVALALSLFAAVTGFGQDAQSSPAPANLDPDAATPGSFGADSSLLGFPNAGPASAPAPGRGMRSSGRGFGSADGQPLFPASDGACSPGHAGIGSESGVGSSNSSGSFDWAKFFADASQISFRFAAPRLFPMGDQGGISEGALSSGGMMPIGGASIFDPGGGLLRAAGASSTGALDTSLSMLG